MYVVTYQPNFLAWTTVRINSSSAEKPLGIELRSWTKCHNRWHRPSPFGFFARKSTLEGVVRMMFDKQLHHCGWQSRRWGPRGPISPRRTNRIPLSVSHPERPQMLFSQSGTRCRNTMDYFFPPTLFTRYWQNGMVRLMDANGWADGWQFINLSRSR